MLAGSCQGSLCAECGLPILVVGREILVRDAAVRPELFVFGRPAGTVERFGISDAVVATTPASISWRRRRGTSGWRILAAAAQPAPTRVERVEGHTGGGVHRSHSVLFGWNRLLDMAF